jgi:hypothetical protein
MEHLKKTIGLRSTFDGLLRIGVLMLVAVCGCVPAAAQTSQFIALGSVDVTETHSGNGRSTRPTLSGNGGRVVFESSASDLLPHDTNGTVSDIFTYSFQVGNTQLVSVNMAGTGSGNNFSDSASITFDGRFIIFRSDASDIVPNDNNNRSDIFIRDLVAQTTQLVSVNGAGNGSGNGGSFSGLITPDGRYVVFTSAATDLLASPTQPGTTQIYRRDLQTGTTILVSRNASATGGNNGATEATTITPDGRYVVFTSASTDLTANDTNGIITDVFRRDILGGTTMLASVNNSGTDSGNAEAIWPVMSDDGQVVAFQSAATNLVPSGGAGTGFTSPSIYVHNFTANTTTLVSEMQVFQAGVATIPPARFPRISADGRFIFYVRQEMGGLPLNRQPFRDRIFRRDRATNALLELPFVATGICDQDFNCTSQIALSDSYVTSHDGRYVAYSQLERLRNNPTPFSSAIVIRDMIGGGTEVVLGQPGLPFNNPPPQDPLRPGALVADGNLAFSSGVNHLPTDGNADVDVYKYGPPDNIRWVFDRASYSIVEDGSVSVIHGIKVHRTGYLINNTQTVNYATSDGTAVAGSDYLARSETLIFGPGESDKLVNIPIINDEVPEPNKTLNLTLGFPTGLSMLGPQSSATLTIIDDDLHAIQFSAATYEVSEPDGSLLVTVTLDGIPDGPFTVDYRTANGTASERSDYITASGRLHFADGETSKTFRVLVVDDGFVEGDETVNLSLTNPQGVTLGPQNTAQLIIHSNDATPAATNPIDTSAFFVRQHYLDFLNRDPDADGLAFWTGEIESCGANQPCREVKRINVSAAFFLSIEFQETGFLTYLTNKAALGMRPTFAQFELEVQRLQRDFVFGQPGAPAQLEANKRVYFDEFVTRPEFTSKFNGMNNTQYVTTLLSENGLSTTIGDVFVSRLEGQTPSNPGEAPPGIFILRRDPFNPSSTTVRLSLRLNTLTSTPTAVHIHGPVTDGGVAPILHTLPAGEFSDLPLTLTNEQINLLNTGRLTVDVHTENNPNGELSAQLGPGRFRADVLTNSLNSLTLTRAEVLRIVAESEELRRAEFNAAFVLMEYFGYLRRDPDTAGYDFWLGKLNEFGGDFIKAEMVKAFISSAEYRQRFGQ